jgi:MGT family glycosyltransferase
MAKALFLGLPLHGHTNPSLPLVRALVDRGDEVVYFSRDEFADAIRQTGARYCAYRATCMANVRRMSERTDKLSWFLMDATRDVLAHDFDAFREEQPDYIISDSVAPWGQWAAQILGVPVVTSVTTFVVNRHVLALAASRGTRPKSVRLALSKIRHVAKAAMLGRRLRRAHGVPGTSIMGLMFGSSDLNIVYTSRQFQPCAETFDDRFIFIGPSIDLRSTAPSIPREEPSPADLIYISLGTLFNADPTFYRTCFEAFCGQNVRVIMSIGTTVADADVGTPPPNITVLPWVPQLEVLQRAAVFVSHGGMNSVSESLHYGVPLVVVPQMGEQEMVARQVEACGAGLFLAKSEVTADRLRQSVNRVLGDEQFRTQAALIRDSFDAAGGAARGADAILAFTRARASLHTR